MPIKLTVVSTSSTIVLLRKNMKKVNALDIVLSVISVLFVLGSAILFDACPAKPEGGFMACHWANRAATAVGVVIFALSIESIFVSNQIKIGLNSGIFALAILLAIIPGILINLCKMQTMRCWTTFRPAVLVFAILIALFSVLNLILLIRKEKK